MFAKCVIILVTVGCYFALPIDEEVKALNPQTETRLVLNAVFPTTGYMVVQDTQNGTNYLISTKKKVSYASAIHICKRSGMRLFRVDSPQKNEVIKNLISTYTKEGPFWMAANRLSDGRTWNWADGSPISYYNWDDGEPNNAKHNEYCIEVYHRDAVWDDQSCSEKIYFICEDNEDYTEEIPISRRIKEIKIIGA